MQLLMFGPIVHLGKPTTSLLSTKQNVWLSRKRRIDGLPSLCEACFHSPIYPSVAWDHVSLPESSIGQRHMAHPPTEKASKEVRDQRGAAGEETELCLDSYETNPISRCNVAAQ